MLFVGCDLYAEYSNKLVCVVNVLTAWWLSGRVMTKQMSYAICLKLQVVELAEASNNALKELGIQEKLK